MTDDQARITIRDVAQRAGVALSSVSRVLSGHPDVSDGLRRKVEEAVAFLGYEPSFVAQSMRSGTTRTIGFVLRDIGNPLFAEAARACEKQFRAAGYSMIVVNSDAGIETEVINLGLLRRRRVDGIIASLVSETAPETKEALHELKIPVVLLDREVEGFTAGAVHSDHYRGVRSAVEYLLARGHTRIMLIAGELAVRSTRERVRGYVDAVEGYGLAVNPAMVVDGSFDLDFAADKVIRSLSQAEPPTAVLGGGIGATAGILRALRQLRIEVGTGIEVVALDEWPLFDVSNLNLPSVARDGSEMGRAAGQLLLDMLDGAAPRTITLETEFRPR